MTPKGEDLAILVSSIVHHSSCYKRSRIERAAFLFLELAIQARKLHDF